MTVAQGLFHDRKIPAMLMEQMIEYNSNWGIARRPRIGSSSAPGWCERLRKLFGVEIELPVPIGVEGAARRRNARGVLHFPGRQERVTAGVEKGLGTAALAQREAAFEQQRRAR